MDKKVLFFGFTDSEMKTLRAVLSPLGAELDNILQEEWDKSIGALLGLLGCGFGRCLLGNLRPGLLIHVLFLLPVNKKWVDRITIRYPLFYQDSMSLLLFQMKNAGFGTDVLKAVATPANISWTPGQLYRELSAEHAHMNRSAK